jgi:preprotein translocase subunit SecF
MIKLMAKMLKLISEISTRAILYLLIASSLICIGALRHNNQTMVKLRDAVYTADKNNQGINQALNNLRQYVYGHMNANLSSGNNGIKPPVQLKYTYQRLVEAQQNQIQVANSKTYADAQAYCKSTGNAQFDNPCVQNYVVNHGVKSIDVSVPAGLYQFDFVSPSWSPDLAGWSLVASIILLLALLVKLGLDRFRQ